MYETATTHEAWPTNHVLARTFIEHGPSVVCCSILRIRADKGAQDVHFKWVPSLHGLGADLFKRGNSDTRKGESWGKRRWWALGWNRRVTCDWSKTLSWGCSRRRWAKTTISAGIKDGIVHTMWIGEAWIASDNNSGSSVGRVSDNDERAPSSRGLPWNCDIGTMSVKTKSVMEQSSGGAISNYKTTSEFSR